MKEMMMERRDVIAGAAILPAALGASAAAAATGGGPALSRDPWLSVIAEVAAPQLFGRAAGYERRCVPILGGSARGRFEAVVLPGGADWQRVLPDGTTELEAHYALRTAAGDLVEVSGGGVRSGPPEAMKALLAGQPVDPALIYFRASYRFATAAPALADFTRRIFIGVGRREPSRVLIDIYAVE
jgi:hypothetical protein